MCGLGPLVRGAHMWGTIATGTIENAEETGRRSLARRACVEQS